jgi:hypothetical protein
MKLTVNPIYKLIAQGEHQQQDFKFCINDSRKIAKSLVAFANSDGGRLLIGVKDNGNVIGIRSEEEFYMVEAAAKIYSKPKIEFTVQEWNVEGKIVLEIDIEPSKERPHYAQLDDGKWIAYIRHDDENILANSVLLKSWELENNKHGLLFKYDEPRRVLINYLSENSNITLSKFVKIAQITRFNAEKILAELLFMHCISAHFEQVPVNYSLNENFDLEQLS